MSELCKTCLFQKFFEGDNLGGEEQKGRKGRLPVHISAHWLQGNFQHSEADCI